MFKKSLSTSLTTAAAHTALIFSIMIDVVLTKMATIEKRRKSNREVKKAVSPCVSGVLHST